MDGSRTKKSILNISVKMGSQIVSMLLSFISRTVFIHAFGREFLGMNSLFSEVLSWLSLADLGFGVALAYSFYKPLAENDEKRMAALMSFYKTVYNVIAAAIAVIGICLIPFLDHIVNVESPIEHMTLYYVLSLIGMVGSYLFAYKTVIIVADQKEYILTGIGTVISLITVTAQIVVLLLTKNYILYLLIQIISQLLGNLYKSYKTEKLYPFIKNKERLALSEKKAIFHNIGSVFIYKMSSVMLNASDNTIISVLLGTALVGGYSNYQMLNTKISGIFTMFFTTLTATIGNIIVKEKAEKRYEIFRCEQCASFILSGVVVPCFAVLANDFVRLWLGTGYLIDTITVYVIALNMYMAFVYQPLWSYREATGMYQKTKWVMLVCAFVNIGLSIFLGKQIGLAGILLATFISKLCTYGWYEPVLLFKLYFDKSAKKYFIDLFLNFLLIVCTTVLLTFISKRWFTESWIVFIGKGFVMAAISMGIVCVSYWKTETMQLLLKKGKQMLSRR